MSDGGTHTALDLELALLHQQRQNALVPPAGPPNHGHATPHWQRERERLLAILDRNIGRLERLRQECADE